MRNYYLWSGVLVGSFLFLPSVVTLGLSFFLLALCERYYFPLLILFLSDLTGEGVHSFTFQLFPPFNHLYFPLTVFGIIVCFIARKLRQFVWTEKVGHI
jgi:hypothetical protein